MKGKYLDAVLAAGREARSVALATEIASGAQLLLDDDGFDGDLQLDDAGARDDARARCAPTARRRSRLRPDRC